MFAQILTANQGRIKQKHYLQEIPYQKIKGSIIVPVTINGKIYNFIFDTGATLAISDKIFKELHLKVIKQINAFDENGERETMKLILLPEIDIHGITFRNTPGVVFLENAESSRLAECFGIDGVIGSNMLRNSVVQFDEQNRRIILTDNIKKLSLQTHAYQKMKLSPWQSAPHINVTLQKGGQKVNHNVLFDTGNSGFFRLSLNESNSCVVDTIVETEGWYGFGSHGAYKKQNNLLLRIPKILVHEFIFTDVITTKTQGNDSGIGNIFLQYGKTTLDYKKKRFYFEPHENIRIVEHSEIPDAVGFTFQNNKMVVGIIWDKELESQTNVGDEVLSINGIDIQGMNLCETWMLEIPPSDKYIYELRDIHTGEIKKIEIKQLQINKDKENDAKK